MLYVKKTDEVYAIHVIHESADILHVLGLFMIKMLKSYMIH